MKLSIITSFMYKYTLIQITYRCFYNMIQKAKSQYEHLGKKDLPREQFIACRLWNAFQIFLRNGLKLKPAKVAGLQVLV